MKNPEIRAGVIFPTREIGTDPMAIRDFVRGAETMGFSFLLTYDHIVGTKAETGNNRYTNRDTFHEPLTLFAYVSGQTSTIELITGVVVTPQRETPLLAKQAAEVDLLSHERLTLGVGVGSNDHEFALLGHDFSTRGKRLEQQVVFMRNLWTNDLITQNEAGQHTEAFGINPRPRRSIPIWMGGWADAVLERTARLADGWMPMGNPEDVEPRIEKFRTLLQKNGKDPAHFPIMGAFGRRFSLDGEKPRTIPAPDNLDEWVAILSKWQAMNVSDVAFRTGDFGFKGVDEHLRHLKILKREFDNRTNPRDRLPVEETYTIR